MQADRRRINGPAGGTTAPIFLLPDSQNPSIQRPHRTRDPSTHRKLFLRTGVVPSASGSAYYEIPPSPTTSTSPPNRLTPSKSSLKITCTVHGPRPLPRNAAFSPNLLLTTHIKFAPFATRQRRGYVRDASERDLSLHLEAALRGVVIGERWPKSGCEVVITILEGEEDGWWADKAEGGWGLMSVLAGCITVASAALVDAGIDCVDFVTGGVAGVVREEGKRKREVVIDPSPAEGTLEAACVVGYLRSRDEITEIWMKGDVGGEVDGLIDQAVKAAVMTRSVLMEVSKEAAAIKVNASSTAGSKDEEVGAKVGKGSGKDVVMNG